MKIATMFVVAVRRIIAIIVTLFHIVTNAMSIGVKIAMNTMNVFPWISDDDDSDDD